MIGKILSAVSATALLSCSSEKINLSPFPDNLMSGAATNNSVTHYSTSVRAVGASSEITNLTSTFPTFKNVAVNREVSVLKNNLELYIYAVEAYNKAGEQRNLAAVEQSYKKLQILKPHLSADEQDTLNRYLVRIKTNLSQLEEAAVQNSH